MFIYIEIYNKLHIVNNYRSYIRISTFGIIWERIIVYITTVFHFSNELNNLSLRPRPGSYSVITVFYITNITSPKIHMYIIYPTNILAKQISLHVFDGNLVAIELEQKGIF